MVEQENEFMEVANCITGGKPVNERVLESVSILSERLERLKQQSSLFSGVSFSDEVAALAGHQAPTAVC